MGKAIVPVLVSTHLRSQAMGTAHAILWTLGRGLKNCSDVNARVPYPGNHIWTIFCPGLQRLALHKINIFRLNRRNGWNIPALIFLYSNLDDWIISLWVLVSIVFKNTPKCYAIWWPNVHPLDLATTHHFGTNIHRLSNSSRINSVMDRPAMMPDKWSKSSFGDFGEHFSGLQGLNLKEK